MFCIKIEFKDSRLFINNEEIKGVKKALAIIAMFVGFFSIVMLVAWVVLSLAGFTMAIMLPIIAVILPIFIVVGAIAGIVSLIKMRKKD